MEPQNEGLEDVLLKWVIFRFHVSFLGCRTGVKHGFAITYDVYMHWASTGHEVISCYLLTPVCIKNNRRSGSRDYH